ncbi:MAG: HTH domain-containing protein [Clostridia bacterium]|nr:HTH domain-containing protein [Clostridia bacterium]
MRNEVLFDIMLTVLSKKIVTARFLAEKYNMSTRSIYRYIDTLSTSIPIATKSGKNGGIYILNTFSPSNIFFTNDELHSLRSAIDTIPNPNIKDSITQKLNISKAPNSL